MKSMTQEERSWCLYDVGNSAYSMTITSTILPIFLASMMKSQGYSADAATSAWGYVNAAASLLIALLSPFFGTLADYHGFKKKFFSFFACLGILFTALLGWVPAGQWRLLLAVYVLSAVGFSGANIFYDSFLTDICPADRMDKVSSYGFAWGYLGSTIPFLLSMGVVMLSDQGLLPFDALTATRLTFVITALWWLLFSVPLWRHVRQRYGVKRPLRLVQASFGRLRSTFTNIRQHKQAFWFLLAYFFYIDGVDTIIRMATSFGTSLGIGSQQLLWILLVTQFVAFPCALIYGHLAQRYGAKKMLLAGILVYIGICVYAFFLRTVFDFWVLALMVGTSQGGIQAISRSYFGKLIPPENSNEFFGFYNIFGKFAAILGPLLVALVTQWTGQVRYGVLGIVGLFLAGGALLLKVHADPSQTPL